MSGNDPIPPHEVWWRLLQGRLAQACLTLPDDLVGTVQFEVTRGEGAPVYFFLALDGRRSYGASGLTADARAWIETDDAQLERLLDGKAGPGALAASGDTALPRRFFEKLAHADQPMSQIALRSQR